MTSFPSQAESSGRSSERRSACSERYGFQVGAKHYALQFCPVTYREDYDDRQLAALEANLTYEVSFRLEHGTLPDGTILSGYDTTGTGTPFRVLGGVANGILDWANERRPTFLYWQAAGTQRQRLYERIVRSFAARGSGWHRLSTDPFTGLRCQPDTFWLGNTSHHPLV